MKTNKDVLLPFKFKKLSSPFLLIGTGLLYLYFKGIKPDFMNIKVFAVLSTYMENRSFQVVQTNLMDELGVTFLMLGVTLLIFTKEKGEINIYRGYRLTAFMQSSKYILFIWLLGYWLFYGYVIFAISLGMFMTYLLLYYLIFRYLIWKNIFKNNTNLQTKIYNNEN